MSNDLKGLILSTSLAQQPKSPLNAFLISASSRHATDLYRKSAIQGQETLVLFVLSNEGRNPANEARCDHFSYSVHATLVPCRGMRTLTPRSNDKSTREGALLPPERKERMRASKAPKLSKIASFSLQVHYSSLPLQS